MARKVEITPLAPEVSQYREVQIGKTIYHVTSIYTGEKELGKTLEQLAVRKVLNEIQQTGKALLQQ